IKFTNKIDSQLKVNIDPTHTYRIFHNLFRNAVQAMQGDDAGKNTNKLTVSAVKFDEKVSVLIIDTGPGLPDNVRNNLFKAFTTGVGKGGTGLGLTIARELARAQGGNLLLEKTGVDGTTFIVELPSV
ncbi:MAG: HAMP domain-containing histidine kinase, partial [Robiginitomaculum sp.]|nr:HAMP domain-containing histidine kinase [Robiginitomaculum sp.]